jgi:membrane protein
LGKKNYKDKAIKLLKNLYSELKYYAIGLYNKFDEDHVWVMAASIAFNIIICIIPITLILFSLLGIYIQQESAQQYLHDSLDKVVGITPELKEKITNVILNSFNELSRNSLITAIIGGVGILWTASGLFSAIRDVLNRVYKTRSETFYLWIKLKDVGMIFLILTVFMLSFSSTFILSIFNAIDRTFFDGALLNFSSVSKIVSHLIGLIFTFIMFYLIFKLVPEGYVNPKLALISSITAAVLSESLKYLFVLYLTSFANYQRVYGTYSALVGVIFWLYYSSLTFVIGAEVGQLYKEKKLIKKSD